MSATGFSVTTYAFPDPSFRTLLDSDFKDINKDFKSQISFNESRNDGIRSLSTYTTTPGQDLSGLLYSPALTGSSCDTSNYVPQNASRVAIPKNQLAWIAIAPWISAQCTLSYLAAAQGDPIRAFVFYLTDNSTGIPPPSTDLAWSLGDGGRWKQQYKFPVYAVPSDRGNAIIQGLANYSGNMSSVPNAQALADKYPSSYYVRLVMTIDLGGNTLPSLWVFLLIVLGILMLIIGSTSFFMHVIQRKRRANLRRRIGNGEVDLDALGIKRLTVPKDVLDKMPVYLYASSPNNRMSTAESDILMGKEGSITTMAANVDERSYSQPTCAICLDDFVGGESQVRELPCKHIFHPECIDVFLKENSSLCPMCKKTALPRGYCPAVITNAMVRRERLLRRLRERNPEANLTGDGIELARQQGIRGVIARFGANGRRVFAAPIRTNNTNLQAYTATPTSPTAVEMRTTTATAAREQQPPTVPAPIQTSALMTSTTPPIQSPRQTDPCIPSSAGGDPAVPTMASSRRDSRREWARQRAMAMVGQPRRGSVMEAVEEEERRRPVWRRAVGRVWPGLA